MTVSHTYREVTCIVGAVENLVAEDREVERETKTEGASRGRLDNSDMGDSCTGPKQTHLGSVSSRYQPWTCQS